MPPAVTRWDPFTELSELRTRVDRVLGDWGLFGDGERAWIPAVDVERRDDELIVRADVPGIKPDEVKIEVEDNILTVSGKHEETKEEKDKQYMRRERRSGSFSRSMALPPGVDPKTIKATTHDGVVEVTIPLPKEQKEKVQITPTAA
ncbi:MAG TPA: Hsp20/alpha crystallin family protein [Solirubrobacteraceae bacterium]|nr:Hsp20/alpha crystallin family protein [Solirubrobacteraceae bacterium]